MAHAPVPAGPEAEPPKAKKNLFVKALIALFVLAALGVAAIAAGYGWLNWRYETPMEGPENAMVFSIPKGATLTRIANDLEQAGMIEDAFIFKTVTQLRGHETAFKAGEFMVGGGQSMAAVFDQLTNGRAILYPFTAPEGTTSAQIVRALVGMETLVNDNPAVPPEGTLLPETYLTPRGMTQSALLSQMATAQVALLDELWEQRAPDLPIKTKQEAIILASVVEKETGIGMERDMVAGVFINRLRRGMRLQSDPTIIYGITQGEPLGRRIRRSEIDRRTDWNTYQIDGLPATPICNPGTEAIRSVLNPAETDALFFVADGTGGHAFARTLREHERNVAKWRQIQRERGLR